MQNWLERYMLNECLLIFSIVIAILVLTIFGQRKTWMKTDSLLTITCGIAFLIFPKKLLTVETNGEIRSEDENVATCFGIMLLCSGLNWLKYESSRDGTVVITLITSKIFISGMLFFTLCCAYFFNKPTTSGKDKKLIDWSEQTLYMGIIPLFLWLCGHILHLFKSSDFNSFPQHNTRINIHLRLQAFIVFFCGIVLLAFPGKISGVALKVTSGKVVLHFVRSIGSILVGSSFIALQAPSFLHDRDKKNVFLIQFLTSLLQMLYLLWLTYKNVIELKFLYIVGIIYLPLCLNAVAGIFHTQLVYKVEQPKIN